MKRIINNNRYIFGIGIFITLVFALVTIIISNSYALSSFGQLNLSCDKTVAWSGEELTCSITGEVMEGKSVSSLSARIGLSDNLELVSFTTDEIWEGDGENGDIQLYTAENKTSLFSVGNFVVRVKEGAEFNSSESITLSNIKFYDEEFKANDVDDNGIPIMMPEFSSEKYDLTKNYIVVDTTNVTDIIKEIETSGCDSYITVDSNLVTTGTISDGSVLKIMRNDNLIKEYTVVYYGSNKYDLSKKYVIDSNIEQDSMSEYIDKINCDFYINNNKMIFEYDGNTLGLYDIILLNETNSKINLEKKYVLINEAIKSDFSSNVDLNGNATLNVDGNTLEVIYDSKVVLNLNIVSFYSDKYEIDSELKYINVYNDIYSDSIKDNINSNVEFNVENTEVMILLENKVIEKYIIVGFKYEKYLINGPDKYIYTKFDVENDVIRDNITTLNSSVEIDGNQLFLKYGSEGKTIYTADIKNIAVDAYRYDDNTIYIDNYVTYNDFVDSFYFNGLDNKVYNDSNVEVKDGKILNNYSLKLYSKGKLIDAFDIKVEYMYVSEYSVSENDKIIYNVKLGTTYSDFVSNIDTSGKINIYNASGDEIDYSETDSDAILKSYDVVKVMLGDKVLIYNVSVFGDVTGSGNVTAGDVAKLYQGVRNKITLDKVAILAGELTFDEEIAVNDVAKLYAYLKKRIDSLN